MSDLLRAGVLSLLSFAPVIGVDEADRLFAHARQVSDADGGRLWGRKLYGPMLFVDQATRTVVANEPDNSGVLEPQGGVYAGMLPDNVTVANTATRWAGKHWTMLLWPLPDDERARANLLAHEMWHRIQDDLGLPANNPGNAHLDTPDGRLWLQLEWRALERALRAEGDERKTAVVDALTFREYRRSLFGEAAQEERALENNEGLAEYTGVMLAGWTAQERIEHVLAKLREAERADSYVRSFAYQSGPPWGMLLDALADGWRTGYAVDDDLGVRLSRVLDLELSADLKNAAMKRMVGYDGPKLQKEEEDREQQRQQRLKEARARFVDGPTLRIPLRRMQIAFNPNNLQPLEDVGTVYPTLRISDVWGILEVTGGALVSADWTWVAVPVDATWDGRVDTTGAGWNLKLEKLWVPVQDKGAKAWRLVEKR